MDILDIDEALKDDSYIFLADKTHDDISNILQQWKTNNQQMQQQIHLEEANEQAYKHNSKTFTRSKRRLQPAANPETQRTQTQNGSTLATNSGSLMLSLEIGGLVTNMHKSFLQDTSPPSSICTSMNNGCMNSSLISSADFTNLNFLHSINSSERFEVNAADQSLTATTSLTNDGGYTFIDMVRDRKALESLTMSGDGTLIKDSHIGQIDDISLTPLSKTASGCSTMDNSTDSVATPNELQLQAEASLCKTMLLNEDMIGDITVSLVDSLTSRTTTDSMGEGEANFKLKKQENTAVALNETQLVAGRQVNSTFTEGYQTPETGTRCDTPENIEKKLASIQMQSTPLTTASGRSNNTNCNNFHNINSSSSNNNNNNNNKPIITKSTLKGREDIFNLSPIVDNTMTDKGQNNRQQQQLNNTYEPPTPLLKDLHIEASPEIGFDGPKFVLDTMHLLEQIEQPALDATYNKSEEHLQMQCVMDLAEAEVELLAQQGDEEQFEHMLAELGKINAPNAEQLKIQKSLDSIKRRFQKDEEHTSPSEHHLQQQQQTMGLLYGTPPSSQSQSQLISSQSSSSGERLLSRRSRLYDDLMMSAMHGSDTSTASCNSTSFIVQRNEHEPANISSEICAPVVEAEQHALDINVETNRETVGSEIITICKPVGRRNRDRERFKTIKITKEMRARDEDLGHIVVPCIDDEDSQTLPLDTSKFKDQQRALHNRLSRLDQMAIGNMSGEENSGNGGNNYLTYKKPKEKSLLMHQQYQHQEQQYQHDQQIDQKQPHQPQQQERQTSAGDGKQIMRSQQRSLSRPRYISGLQRPSTVCKATSAGAGLNAGSTTNQKTRTAEATQSGDFGGLKSPMGIKSKSFHNLSSNINSSIESVGAVEMLAARPRLGAGLRRPSIQVNTTSNMFRATQQREQDERSVFKMPKSVAPARAPTTAGVKRTVGNGLARPSSGYYSLSTKGSGEVETSESLSSTSSRGSSYGKDVKLNDAFDPQALSVKLTSVTTSSTGILKPSGLRQPSQMKRSGLPRPSSILKR